MNMIGKLMMLFQEVYLKNLKIFLIFYKLNKQLEQKEKYLLDSIKKHNNIML